MARKGIVQLLEEIAEGTATLPEVLLILTDISEKLEGVTTVATLEEAVTTVVASIEAAKTAMLSAIEDLNAGNTEQAAATLTAAAAGLDTATAALSEADPTPGAPTTPEGGDPPPSE